MRKKNRKSFKNSLYKKRLFFYWLGLFLVALLTGLLVIFQNLSLKKYSQLFENTKWSFLERAKYPRRLDGVFLFSKKLTNLWPVAVMIDNQTEARPPVGLSKASLVIESLTEGRITRFLAIFDSGEKVEKIGPVRSARPYFLEWAEEFKALFIHSGGSPMALKGLSQRKYDVYDVNEFYWGKYFWRDNKRKRPHNLFITSSFWPKIFQIKKIDNKIPSYRPWKFKRDISYNLRKERKQIIKINYQSPDYFVEWHYQPLKNNYLRYQAGKEHLDENGQTLTAKNLVVQYVKMRLIDEIGRREIITQGTGRADIFLDGKRIEGKWEKRGKLKRTLFFNEKGEEIRFNRGTTWIEIVPFNSSIVSYQE